MSHLKSFVLDTNVLLHDPEAIHLFDEHTVIIPIQVVEEIDNFKKNMDELGRNAREFTRILDSFRDRGCLRSGVPTQGGGTLKIALEALPVDTRFIDAKVDNLIMGAALHVQKNSAGDTILVTKDANLRVRADALGLRAENFLADQVKIEDLYPGTASFEVPGETIDRLYDADGSVEIPEGLFSEVRANQYLVLRSKDNAKHSALARVDSQGQRLRKLHLTSRGDVFGIRPRNKEQHFALDALLDPDIHLVTLVGFAGTGKTLLACAAGLENTLEDKRYDRLTVARPVIPMGKDIGFLPGTLEEKMHPWMQPIFDNVELLMGVDEAARKAGRSYHELIDLGMLQIEPLTYIRGRSIPRQYILLDEAQNLSPLEVKTIITRAGEGTKIVLTGDPYQIDNPYVDSQSNGLSYVVEKFKGQSLAATVTMRKGERSALADLAAKLL